MQTNGMYMFWKGQNTSQNTISGFGYMYNLDTIYSEVGSKIFGSFPLG